MTSDSFPLLNLTEIVGCNQLLLDDIGQLDAVGTQMSTTMKKLEKRLATLQHDIQRRKKCKKDLTKHMVIYIFKKHIHRLSTTSRKRNMPNRNSASSLRHT